MNKQGMTMNPYPVGGQPLADDEKGCVSISFSLPYWEKAVLNRLTRENQMRSRSSLINGVLLEWLRSQGITEQTEGSKS